MEIYSFSRFSRKCSDILGRSFACDHRSDGTMKSFITSQIYNLSVFPLYFSLLSNRCFEMGRSNKVRHRFQPFFQTDNFITNILLPMYQEDFYFYHIIGICHPNCCQNTQKRTKSMISSNPKSWPAWMTFELRKWKTPPVHLFTKWRQRISSNHCCARWLANRT